MYNDKVTMLSVAPDGAITEVGCEPNNIVDTLCRTIESPAVGLITLPHDVQLWVNAAGRRSGAEPNVYSAAVIAALDLDMVGAVALGTIVLAGARGEATVSLDDNTRQIVTRVVLRAGGQVAPTMRSVPMDGGRAWEWQHRGVHFHAESHNGSTVVRLHFRTDAPDSEWTVSAERDTDGRSAKSVAEEMFRDTTGGAR